MKRQIVILQNTEIGSHLALSIFLTNLLKNYKQDDEWEYSLICWERIQNSATEQIANTIKIFETHTWLYRIGDNINFTIRSFTFLRAIQKEKWHIDFIHAFYPNSSLLAWVLFKILCSWKTKIIYDIRSPWIEMSFTNNHLQKKQKFVKNIMHLSEYILTRWVSKFIFITEWTKEYYQNKYSLKNINATVIPSWVDVEKFQQTSDSKKVQELKNKLSIQDDDIVIWYVGTIAKMRQLEKLISDNIENIRWSHIKFLFVGDGDWLEELKNTFQNGNITQHALFVWKKSPEEIPELMQLFDYWLCHLPNIFVFENSFPLKVLEYISAWKKVLCSDIKTHRMIQQVFPKNIVLYATNPFTPEIRKQSTEFDENVLKYSWKYLVSLYRELYNS